ncbi:MAG TPA: PAS domain S-box protein [Geobacteraceae bacterium]|nr:PAS domain S-box protein [Geobacteraceae bacterium]
MQNTRMEILLIEGDPADAGLVMEMLAKDRKQEFSVRHVRTLAEGLQLLSEDSFDCTLVDLTLPDSQGLETALAVRNQFERMPVVILAAQDDEDAAFKALQMNIQDFLVKGEINGGMLTRSIRYAVQRKRISEKLQESEEEFRETFNQAAVGIAHLAPDGSWLRINRKYCDIVGYTEEEMKAFAIPDVTHPDDLQSSMEHYRRLLNGEIGNYSLEKRYVRKDGSVVWVNLAASMVTDAGGNPRFVIGFVEDITPRMRVEEALRFSEERYRALYLDNPTMIFTLDSNWTILSANPSCAAHLGFSIDELEGRSGLEVFHEDDRPAVDEQLRKCLRSPDRVYRWQFRKIRKDGELLWVEETARAVYDLKGEINILIVCQDITERRRVEETLNRAKEEWELTFDSVPDLIAIMDDEYRIIRINRAMAARLGRHPKECIGLFCYKAIHNVDSPPETCPHSRTLADARGHDAEMEEGHLGGVFHVSATPLLTPEGKMRGVVHVARDITERKLAEAEIKRLNADLAARTTELEAFNYTVAHDLRKPLTVVNCCCQTLMELCGDRLDEECTGYLRDAYDGTWRMNRLIDALLEFSRLANARLSREMVDLSEIAQASAAELELADPERRVIFRLAEGVIVNGDAGLLRVVMDNLLGNAWKYTAMREEGIIEFGVLEIDGEPAFFVRDNGAGFDMLYAGRLFIPFHRLPGVEEISGFGIGLATVERIIKRHGGRIWAEGKPDRGATFYFTLGDH